MKNKKKILSLLACLSLLTSCNKSTPSSSSCKTTTSTPSVDPTPEEINIFDYANTTVNEDGTLTLNSFNSSLTNDMKLKIEEITLPDNITVLNRVYGGLFKGFNNLKKIYLPKTLKTIVYGSNSSANISPFQYLPSLEDIIVDEENENYKVLPNTNCLLSVTKENDSDSIITTYDVIAAWGDVVIPEVVTESSFKGSFWFANLDSITSIKFHSKFKKLYFSDFQYLPSLKNIDPNGMEGYVVEGNVLYDSKLSEPGVIAAWGDVVLPSAIKIDVSFSGLTSITSIDLNNGTIKNISSYGLSNLNNLKKINIPSTITSIANSAFAYDNKLEEITSNNEIYKVEGNCLYDSVNKKAIAGYKDVIIPENVEIIGSLNGCTSMTSIYISKNVKSINLNAFSNINSNRELDNYLKITLDENNTYFNTNNDNGCFSLFSKSSNCLYYISPNKNKEIIIPFIFETIKFTDYLFTTNINYKHVTKFIFSKGIKTIDCSLITNSLFNDKNEKFTMELPSTLENIISVTNKTVSSPFAYTNKINDITFNNNQIENDYYKIEGNLLIKKGKTDNVDDPSKDTIVCGFKNVVIPENISVIQTRAFTANFSITSLTLHKNITNIGNNAFDYLNNLTNIIFNGTIDEFKSYLYSKLKTYSTIDLTYLDESGNKVTHKLKEIENL